MSYERLPLTVLDLHSHPGMRAFFSGTDYRDEVGFQVYGVLGTLGGSYLTPEGVRAIDGLAIRLRVGIYGHFQEIPWSWVFSGSLTDCQDMNNLEVSHNNE